MSGEGEQQTKAGSQGGRGCVLALGLIVLVALLSWVALSSAARSGESESVASKEPTPASEPLTLRLLHTNDTWGQTRPCG